MEAPREAQPSGCGVQGCLYGAVGLFVVLLIVIAIVLMLRFGEPRDAPAPGTPPGPETDAAPAALGARLPVLGHHV